MNNFELNLKIAELLGIKLDKKALNAKILAYANHLGKRWEIFDPINDPVQREPLMMELIEAHIKPRKMPSCYVWGNKYKKFYCSDKHFGISTCLAWIEMMESKDG